MGRRSRARALAVWVKGRRVGEWHIPARGDMELRYDAAWMAAAEGRPLSLSLPFGLDQAPVRGAAVAAYFNNLLPDAAIIRKRLQDQFHTPTRDAFDLLAAIGRDCVGAVQLLGIDEAPQDIATIEARPLSEGELEQALVDAVAQPAFGAPKYAVHRACFAVVAVSRANNLRALRLETHESGVAQRPGRFRRETAPGRGSPLRIWPGASFGRQAGFLDHLAQERNVVAHGGRQCLAAARVDIEAEGRQALLHIGQAQHPLYG